MRRVLIAVVLLLTAIARPVSTASTVTFSPTHPNQPTPQCDGERVASPILYLCIDWVDPASGTIAGWWLDLRTGHAPTGSVVFTPGGPQLPTQTLVIPRPDVAAAFGVADQHLGFGLIMGPMAAGTFAVETTDMPWAWDCWIDTSGFTCGWVASEVVFSVSGV